jgi:hypothetical protein
LIFKIKLLSEITEKRGKPEYFSGGLPLQLLRKGTSGVFGRLNVPVLFFEPNALTSRNDYYYNARQNVLYVRKHVNQYLAVWKPVIFV